MIRRDIDWRGLTQEQRCPRVALFFERNLADFVSGQPGLLIGSASFGDNGVVGITVLKMISCPRFARNIKIFDAI
ncbi:hypothetical protein IB239_13210 [Pseudomonas sp. PDM12]|uniref:hypothetical protein n=1 Tax=Pseudomonas sp. PDM12 TaxID=2769260 RepID=UPI0017811780|nr:hypothetical protein [Pseudomonas sp. PDM12]MBD9655773.1 hypothetical protein [Pseudomonas sp. PDM12]